MSSPSSSPLPIAVLISGGGTTLRNLIEKIDQRRLQARIVLVVSSSPSARGLEFAREAGIPTQVYQRSKYASNEVYGEAVFAELRQAGAELVVMGGFLKLLPVPPDFEHRVINIHPALIPAFCGKGFYGRRVHEAVLEHGARVSGCTVHFVDNQFDHGPIILQWQVPVADDDTPESLARRVFAQECEALPEAINLFADGRLTVEDDQVRIKPAG